METFFTVVHVLLAVFMILVILLQPGKDAGMGAAFGGGASTSAFGGRGAVTFLSKLTAFCAVAFFCTSLGLSFVGMKQSVLAGAESPTPAPEAPADTGKTTPPAAPTGTTAVPAPSATPTTPPAGTGVEEANPADVPVKPAPAAPSGTEAVPAQKLPQ